MERRVVVTGLGLVSPIGNSVDVFWDNIKKSKHGIAKITKFDTSEYKCKLAAEVKNFDISKYLSKRESRRLDLFSQFAIYAAEEAVIDSNIRDIIFENDRAGVLISSGIGGFPSLEEQVLKVEEKGANRINPLFIPLTILNMAAANVSLRFSTMGLSAAYVTACASANNAIGEAFRSIKHNYSDIILAGGSEASISKTTVAGFMALKALSESENPDRASIPFDKERNGFIMGEGAGVLVLEELEHAQKRGAKIYAEIVGYGQNSDAYHMTAPMPDGKNAAKAMKLAIDEAAIEKEDIGYINAHGTSTPANDLAETRAIKKLFRAHSNKLFVSSTKSMTGHLLGGAAAIEAIACIKSLEEGVLPATVGYKVKDEECDLNYIPNKSIKKDISYALSNSFGFGGHNAVVCFKKWEE